MHLKPTSIFLLALAAARPVVSLPKPQEDGNTTSSPCNDPNNTDPGCQPFTEPLKTNVDASDQAINYGSFSPAEVISKLLEECSEVGCSGAKEVEAETFVVDGNAQLQQMKIVISAEGSFNRDKKATREALVEVAKAIASQTVTTSEDSYFDACGTPFCGRFFFFSFLSSFLFLFSWLSLPI